MHEARYNWGAALWLQARSKTGEEADRLFALAMEKSLEAEKVKPGVGAYNLACVAALRGHEEECRNWLKRSKELGSLPSCEYLLADTDLESVRNYERFKEFC